MSYLSINRAPPLLMLLYGLAMAVGAESDAQLPTPGFLVGKSANVVSLKVLEKVNAPIACEVLQFEGGEFDRPFRLVQNKLANDRAYWTDGSRYISYIKLDSDSSAPHGTWILGYSPGVDSGQAHFKPIYPMYVPVNMKSDLTSWRVLRGKQWEAEESMRLTCVEGHTGDHYYSVQHYGSKYSSILVASNLVDFRSHVFPPVPSTSATKISGDWSSLSYWDIHRRAWVSFSTADAVGISEGMPVWLSTVARGKSKEPSYLVNDEGSNGGWMLYFRRSDHGSEVEQRLEIGAEGILNGAQISTLSDSEMEAHQQQMELKISRSRRGDYLWVWVRSNGKGLEPYLLRCEATADNMLHSIPSQRVVSVFSYHDSHRRHIMERSVLSRQTERILAVETDLLNNSNTRSSLVGARGSADIDGATAARGRIRWFMNNEPIEVTAVIFLGADVVSWIENYLNTHEGVLASDISSCFFYHGGLSLPEPLVYAAEIVCVLIGAKPVTMIQYTTKSDKQWKFPLVSELVEAVLAAEELSRFDPTVSDAGISIGFEIFKYGVDESLILFDVAEKKRVDLIKPYHTAQALHIVPYPPAEDMFGIESVHAAHAEQVHNSYFNGILLGYPKRFVESYCNDLQNKLSEGQKREALWNAKTAIASLVMDGVIKSSDHIRINRTVGISEAKWSFIKQHVLSH